MHYLHFNALGIDTAWMSPYLLYSAMDADLVPLIVVESHLIGFDLHFLFAVGEAHRQAQGTVLYCDV